MPLFSIVIPCFNAQKTLAETLDSIIAQSCSDWEVICVDDGSTDETREIVVAAAKNDARIRLARNVGKGPSSARNFGASELSNGKFIAFCDADDIWAPYKLEELQTAFEDKEIDVVYGQIAFFKADPTRAKVFSTVPNDVLTIETLLGENPVCTMSNLSIRKDSFVRFGGFDPSIVHNEDLEWLIRIVGQGGRIVGLKSLHVWYRNTAGGLSSDLAAMRAGREYALATAATFGVIPPAASNAVHLRYLARRALRFDYGRTLALRLAFAGLRQSPTGFLSPPRRGVMTFVGALANVILPRACSRMLFSQ
ncbi:glycosyltransferase family 2 protein [Loktanella sp. S4079]|uniref:glycosyltransferase family 2 protein n=1 Tax=Loktanella sp. S4079 TaxID=579483 RepID=UPI0005FA1BE0|nr:glycosyltransferase family 2 protein [Loktanella sp. S4079]KJZ17650.1 glucosyl transferase [Loktanella sp. S4079]